jgi:hypothetical protein
MSSDKVRKGVKKNYFTSYNMIFETNLSIYAKAVYLYMCRCADSQSQSFPSHADIAIKCSCGITKVKEAIKELESIKLVVKQNRFRKTKSGKMAQTSNLYIVYDRPYDTIPPEELEDMGDNEDDDIIVETPGRNTTPITPSHITSNPSSHSDHTPSRITTTPLSPHDQKGNTYLGTIHFEGLSINKSSGNQMIDGLNDVLKNCCLEVYDMETQDMVKNCITDLYCNENNSKAIGLPHTIIRERLKSPYFNFYAVESTLLKYKTLIAQGTIISAPMKYFIKCLWSAIIDNQINGVVINDVPLAE